MKKLLFLTVAMLGLTLVVRAEDKKLEGEAVCAKCQLKTADKCRAAVTIKTADGKTETYLTEANDEAKALHKEICQGGKPAIVEGSVSEKDGQKIITITKFEIKK